MLSVWFLLLVVSSALANKTDDDITALKNEVAQLRTSMSSLEKQAMARDQKYAKLVSDVLSTLSTLRSDHEASVKVLNSLKDEVNATVADLQTVKDDTIPDIVESLKQLNTSQVDTSTCPVVGNNNVSHATAQGFNDTSFEVNLRSDLFLNQAAILKFNWVKVNNGNHYNSRNGHFTAPVAGMYLFWANIVIKYTNMPYTMNIDIISTKHSRLARGCTTVIRELSTNPMSSASPTVVTKLEQGEVVYFKISATYRETIVGSDTSSYGGTLLHPTS